MDHDSEEILDNSYFEYAVFGLFKIDIVNLTRIKASLAKEFHIQPSEIDAMPVWEYELFMKELNSIVKEDNKRHEEEMDNAGYKDAKKMASRKNVEKMQKQNMQNLPSMPKLNSLGSVPNMSNFKMPSIPKM